MEQGRARVLVVDDDDMLRRMTALVLRRHGIPVEEASDGQHAIDRMREEGFEVLVLDLMMPRVNGWQVVAWLRTNMSAKPRIVVVLTAATKEVLNELDPDVVNTILFKPFDIHELAGYVRACVQGVDLS